MSATTQGQSTDELSCPHCHKVITLLQQSESPSIEDEEESDFESDDSELINDSDYDPQKDSDMSDSDSADLDDDVISDKELHESPALERKFIVYESCLRLLLAVCFLCSSPCRVIIRKVKGSWVELQQLCPNKHTRIWCSQPMHGTMPQGNMCIAAGILFAGCSPSKVLNVFKHCGVLHFTSRTFNKIQRTYLVPAVFRVWTKQQTGLFKQLKKACRKVVLGGDARCDSPGHSAKYSSYTLMDLERNKVIHLELIQV